MLITDITFLALVNELERAVSGVVTCSESFRYRREIKKVESDKKYQDMTSLMTSFVSAGKSFMRLDITVCATYCLKEVSFSFGARAAGLS